MKFSEMLQEYLDLREEFALPEDQQRGSIDARSKSRHRMHELLVDMDELIHGVDAEES